MTTMTTTGMTTTKTDPQWTQAQEHEAEYWGNCLGMHVWNEFVKQEQYGREMGLFSEYGNGSGELEMQGKTVLDVGGGPVSMTLRCLNATKLVVVDPLKWLPSVLRRYHHYGIDLVRSAAENLPDIGKFDEVWMYNVLQHVNDPHRVLDAVTKHVAVGGVFRIFEWLNIPTDKCHLHTLTAAMILNSLTGMRIIQVRIPTLKDYWANGAQALVGVFSP
jgi:2-polyprenyl-3-methyl-5-hydroxy-6-metoxy-1,4-benzoquinol methylase